MGSKIGPSFEDSANVLSSTKLNYKMAKTEFDKIRKVIIINYVKNVVTYERKNIQIFATGVTTHWNSYSCEMKFFFSLVFRLRFKKMRRVSSISVQLPLQIIMIYSYQMSNAHL